MCTHHRVCLFGDITRGLMILNDAGRMVDKWYRKLPYKFSNVYLDEYQIMPNHLHVIIGQTRGSAPTNGKPGVVGVDQSVDPKLGKIIQWFKVMTTNEYIRHVRKGSWPVFEMRLWQRNYYERIVRNENELIKIRQYIEENPLKWSLDADNPNS
jgi:REP element-mobilizing transposase RayT